MTDLEDRVRDALLARAEGFTASPDAWQRTRARAGRGALRRQAHRPARQRWLTRFTPLAAAAAVLVIGAGTAIVAGTGGFGRNPAPQATKMATPAPTPTGGRAFHGQDCAFPHLLPNVPVDGVQISAKVTVNGVTTWWTRIPESNYPQSHANLALCQTHAGGASSGPEGPLRRGQLVRVDNGPAGGLGDGNAVSGIAVASVTSVEADLANGSVARGSVANGRGFPYAAWWLTYPEGIGATLVFRDAAGHVVATVAEPYPPASALKHPAPIVPLAYPGGVPAADRPCQQARVPQLMNGIKVWTYVGFTVPEPVQPNNAKPTLCEMTGLAGAEADFVGVYTNAGQVARRIFVLNPTQTVSGVAVRGVTSVTAELADGRKYTGTFVTGKLFTYPVWLVSYPLKDPATLVFRDAAGKQVAVLHEPANP